MPDYKKKSHHGLQKKPRKTVKKSVAKKEKPMEQDIPMTSHEPDRSQPVKKKHTVRVVKGKKLERQRRFRVVLSSLALLVAVGVGLSFLVPVSIGESITNLLMPIGAGKYPIELYGTQALNAVGKDFYYYVLTDSDLTALSDGGKKIYSVSHGFANPVLKTSTTRALVFDQGGNGYSIYNLKERVVEKTTKETIRTATVSRSGNYAIVTDSDSYTAVVRVYNKKNKLLFEWRSAADMVNNVVLSASGKRLAVSTVNGTNGQLNGKVMIFKFDEKQPVFTADYVDQPVLALETFGSRYLGVFTEHTYTRVHWNKLTKTERTDENPLAMVRVGQGGVLVYQRSSDHSDNRIVYLSGSGEVKNEFSYKGVIGDISVGQGHIYCIGENAVRVFDKKGTLLKSADCPFGGERFVSITSNAIAFITNSEIVKIELDRVEERGS